MTTRRPRRTEPAHDLMTTAQVARVFHVNPGTVMTWAHAGRLSTIVTLGGHYRFRTEQVHRLLATHTEHASELTAQHRGDVDVRHASARQPATPSPRPTPPRRAQTAQTGTTTQQGTQANSEGPVHTAVTPGHLVLQSLLTLADELDRGLAARGHPALTPSRHRVLWSIHTGCHTVAELSRATHIPRAHTATTVIDLIELGYLQRRRTITDARTVTLSLTPLGVAAAEASEQLADQLGRTWQNDTGAQRAASIHHALRALTEPLPPGP